MSMYAMTGGATGIGAALKEKLRARGDRVVVVDIKEADVVADLSTPDGRRRAVAGITELAPDGLDGFVACAGLGPHVRPPSLIDKVNFFGAVATIEGVADLVTKRRGSIVAVSSNSAPLPGLDPAHVEALLAGDEDGACKRVDALDGHNAYAGSKRALARWVRRNAPAYMKRGARLNAIAPGMTTTPLTDKVFEDEVFGKPMRDFEASLPYGTMATPDMIADAMLFLLDPPSRFVVGSVVFVDGGHDALLRPDEF
jgi:NAD(P)-dependent dehydrogenase (short-subunit alcohol dehydrogenase family)